jgi:tetratricopeptide (TPR) repeat protein
VSSSGGGRLLALTAVLVLGACLPAAGGPPGPVVSPTGVVYEPGTPPAQTRFSQTATLYLHSARADRALELATEGIEVDPGNPIHYFLAGVASVRLEAYEDADRLFSEAVRIYPAYELDVEPEREAAWAAAFNAGADAYGSGDTEGAIEAWTGAAHIFDLRPEAHRNLAMVLQLEGRYEAAADFYQGALEGMNGRPATRILEEAEIQRRATVRREVEEEFARLLLVMDRFGEAEPFLRRQLGEDPENVQLRGDLALALSGQGRRDEAVEIYSSLLDEEGLEATQIFNLGIALFRAEDFGQAAEAFQRVTELRPNSRDAWFNYANSLFAAGAWEALAAAGDRLLELDPLNENAALITARAHLETGDEEEAFRRLDRIDDAPVYVEGLLLVPGEGETTVRGRLAGNQAEPGESVRLRFSFYGDAGEVGAEILVLPAPTPGESVPFEVGFAGDMVGYRYEVVR